MAIASAAALPRPNAVLSRGLPESLPPVARETALLLDLRSVSRFVRRGHEIVSEGKRCNSIFLIMQGMAIRYRILRDGQRQILNFLLPGDFAGTTSCRFETALYTIKTLSNAIVSPIPRSRLLGLFETHPHLAAELFLSFGCDPAMLGEHLIGLGRRTAKERIAHLLLELFDRLRRVGLADERSYRLPLTQEMIGDALGLSVPYVNRVLQELRAQGLVRITDKKIVIGDLEELMTLADFEPAYLKPLSVAELLGEHAPA